MAHVKTCAIFVFPAGIVDYATAERGVERDGKHAHHILLV
jgi:hypothetical protein